MSTQKHNHNIWCVYSSTLCYFTSVYLLQRSAGKSSVSNVKVKQFMLLFTVNKVVCSINGYLL